MLENNMEFDFYNSAPSMDRLQNFSVTLTVTTGLNNMQIRCAAKETKESDPVFNSFTDIIIVEKG